MIGPPLTNEFRFTIHDIYREGSPRNESALFRYLIVFRMHPITIRYCTYSARVLIGLIGKKNTVKQYSYSLEIV